MKRVSLTLLVALALGLCLMAGVRAGSDGQMASQEEFDGADEASLVELDQVEALAAELDDMFDEEAMLEMELEQAPNAALQPVSAPVVAPTAPAVPATASLAADADVSPDPTAAIPSVEEFEAQAEAAAASAPQEAGADGAVPEPTPEELAQLAEAGVADFAAAAESAPPSELASTPEEIEKQDALIAASRAGTHGALEAVPDVPAVEPEPTAEVTPALAPQAAPVVAPTPAPTAPLAVPAPQLTLEEAAAKWALYLLRHGNRYNSPEEEVAAFTQFANNGTAIAELNAEIAANPLPKAA